jgi:dephospho-CoA kinase
MRNRIASLAFSPIVIESYPGAAQDILCIPRKQKSLRLLREGLKELGLTGPGLHSTSHDEIDAITSAIVGRFFEAGSFEPMGVLKEAQLVVPKVQPLGFSQPPVICLAGKTGAGKSVVARYLAIFYGFHWIKTRDLIRALLLEDAAIPRHRRMFDRQVNPDAVTEQDLRDLGALILDKYQQAPLRKKLAATVERSDAPIVVDAIRDRADVNEARLGNRPTFVWFIDCSDAMIQSRLRARSKAGAKTSPFASPVDKTASVLRHGADRILPNLGTLEDLRWLVDDEFFSLLEIEK